MTNNRTQLLVSRERRSYLFASICSAVAALFMFYKLFQNDLYLKIADYKWFSIVIALLILGNLSHGFFALKSYSFLNSQSTLDDIIKMKKKYYKSFLINFVIPYMALITLFLVMREFTVATIAFVLLIMMMFFCYFFDFRPTVRLKKKAND